MSPGTLKKRRQRLREPPLRPDVNGRRNPAQGETLGNHEHTSPPGLNFRRKLARKPAAKATSSGRALADIGLNAGTDHQY